MRVPNNNAVPGWILQSQTNALNVGLATNWVEIADTTGVTATNITIMLATPSVFTGCAIHEMVLEHSRLKVFIGIKQQP